MAMIAPQTSIGMRPHRLLLQGPSASVPDGDGGFTVAWLSLTPAEVSGRVSPATAQDLERVAGGSVLSDATHIVTFPYHSQVTTGSRIVFGTRVFNVTGVSNPEERNIETIAICTELVDAPPIVDTSWAQTGWMQ